ncbi:Electron transport complex subunit RnfC [bioreactor metagenome]|uniref:Electron transport complex subunit RnfC n=1 Tax=bioreactor metagenome TaxID=1076179 RepID=A0A645FWZ9_9ZZZZ
MLAFCGGTKGDLGEVITGGPMMGVLIEDTSFPILKQNNGVLALPRNEVLLPEVQPCIHCGRCIDCCPVGLSPCVIAAGVDANDPQEVDRLQVDTCMECGCCTYVCPAKRPVTETMRRAKVLQKKAKKGARGK